jgi:hypothetical protein
MVLIPIWLTALLAATEGEVKLPLGDYLALVQRVEEVERAAAARAQSVEPTVAELTAQRTSIVWEGESASILTTYEVQLRGSSAGVHLPVTGFVAEARIRPEGNASLQSTESGMRFLSPDPGRYEIEVRSRAEVATTRGIGRLAISPFLAPAGELQIAMPEDLHFHCPPAIVAEETVANGERRVRFALPRGAGAVVEARRDLMGAEASELLASAVVVTLVDLRTDGPLRHDVVLYEVSRGRMDVHELALPAGLEVERLLTDEGEVPALAVEGVLRIERTARLETTGFVVVTSRPQSAAEISLAPVVPEVPVRARYLATASSIAATVEPTPEKAWLRVDLDDLPDPLGRAVTLDLVSAFRLEDAGEPLALHVSEIPAAGIHETVITDRDSLTLLTAEGTLVHRERLTLASRANAVAVRLPAGATLWSLQSNDTLVRPIERGSELLVPLGFGNGNVGTIEIVAVQERAVPAEKSRLELSLTEVDVPVLVHRWRVMLPEGNRYRFRSGDLVPPADAPARRELGRFDVEPTSRAMGFGGSASIRGRVVDENNFVLPGAAVTVANIDTGWSATVTADREGSFAFLSLPPGRYSLVAELAGFAPGRYENFPLRSGQSETYAIPLALASVSETVTITGEAPRALSSYEVDRPAEKEAYQFRQEAELLKQGLVGGVKPIPVEIPETGKLLVVTGALPPPQVSVVIEVKPK